MIDAEPVEFRHERIVSRSLDNRVGCYVAAEAARLVAEAGGAPGDVLALAVTQEETTFAGARTSAFAHDPDVAVVVDLTFATDQPGVELGPITKHPLDSGPVIARGTSLHPLVFERLYEAAEAEEIPFTLESLGKGTGTDADAIHLSRAGVPTGLVSVPCRYMHSPVEMVSVGRRRRGGPPDRGLCPAARARHLVRALSADDGSMLVLFDIDGTLLTGATRAHSRGAGRRDQGGARRRSSRERPHDRPGGPDRRRDRPADPARPRRVGPAHRRALDATCARRAAVSTPRSARRI